MSDIFHLLRRHETSISKFFPQLANQTLRKRFAALHLAPRKFPQAAQMIVQPALGNEEFSSLVKNQSCRDRDHS